MAPVTKLDPNELLSVVWSPTGDKVEMPRRLVNNCSKAAQERYLVSSAQLVPQDAPPLPAMDTPADLVQSTIDSAALATVERRLAALEQQPASELPTPDRVEQLIVSAMRAGVSKEEITVVADAAVARVEGVASGFETRLAAAEAKEQALISTISTTLSDSQEAVAASLQAAQQQLASFEAETADAALASAAAIAAKQVGPQGLAGSGVTVAMEDPTSTDPTSWAQRWFGRDVLVAGDGALVPTPTALRVFRYTGSSWLEGPAIEPKVEMVNAQISALDASTKNYPTITAVGGGGGGAADPITLPTLTGTARNAPVVIADSSRWQLGGNGAFKSGTLHLEIIAVDGSFAGLTSALDAAFVVGAGGADGFRFSEYAALGPLLNGAPPAVDVKLTGALQAPSIPAFIGGLPPAGTAQATLITLTLSGGDATSYLVRGYILWAQDPATGTGLRTAPPLKPPAWSLV